MLPEKESRNGRGRSEEHDQIRPNDVSLSRDVKHILNTIEILRRSAHDSEEFWRGYRVALDTVQSLALSDTSDS